MSEELAKKQCTPCTAKGSSLRGSELMNFMNQLQNNWKVIDEHHLEKEFVFPSFREAIAFVNKVADLAESENHHPDIYISYRKVTLKLWTHALKGLSENDFILAAKCDMKT